MWVRGGCAERPLRSGDVASLRRGSQGLGRFSSPGGMFSIMKMMGETERNVLVFNISAAPALTSANRSGHNTPGFKIGGSGFARWSDHCTGLTILAKSLR